MKFIEFLDNHKGVRRFSLLWAATVSTFAIYKTFSDNPPDISMGTATALGSVLALIGTMATFYGKDRHKEDMASNDNE